MRPRLLLSAALWLSLFAAGLTSAQSTVAPLRIIDATVIGHAQEFGSIMSTAIDADGAVYVADGMNRSISKFSPEGALLWSTGRKGRGPGEFQLPGRVAVGHDGTIYVYDLVTAEMTRLDSTGKYIDRQQLPLRFDAFDDVVPLPSGDIAIAGVTQTGRGAGHGVHIFDHDFHYLRSFAPLPKTEKPELLRYWGAGWLTRAQNGDLLYVRKLPYEIYRYSGSGDLKQVVRPPKALVGRPEDAIKITVSPNATRYEVPENTPPIPQRALDIGGYLLSGWKHAGKYTWQVFDANGHLVMQTLAPPGLHGAGEFDAAREILWGAGDVEDEPILWRYRVDVVGGR